MTTIRSEITRLADKLAAPTTGFMARRASLLPAVEAEIAETRARMERLEADEDAALFDCDEMLGAKYKADQSPSLPTPPAHT